MNSSECKASTQKQGEKGQLKSKQLENQKKKSCLLQHEVLVSNCLFSALAGILNGETE